VGSEKADEDKGFIFQELTKKNRLDQDLRPKQFKEFIGQERLKQNLQIYIKAAQLRNEPLDHVLLSGMPGLGKTTLSHIIANEMQSNISITAGPALERSGDLAGILTALKAGDTLFIDEIHRLPRAVEEVLYTAMEDFVIDIVLDKGPAARSFHLNVEHFTLIGATTREGLLTAPLRSRFGVLEKLNLYPHNELEQIISRSMKILGFSGNKNALKLIASRARGVPRVANRLLRRIRDLMQVNEKEKLDIKIAEEGLEMMGIDEMGLVSMDRKILKTIARAKGEPVGLKTVSVSVGEEEDTIETVYEPFLIQKGFLLKTPRGRTITEEGAKHIGMDGDLKGLARQESSLFPEDPSH